MKKAKRTLKKLFATTCLLMNASAALADSGPYVGGSLGVTTNTTSSNYFGSYRGVPLNLFIGYGGLFNSIFYLGGELTGTLTSIEISNQGLVRSTYGVGASLIPGFMLCGPTMVFGRVGIVTTHFTHGSQNATGGQFGLGFQTMMTQNIDLRGEYNFIAYKSINVNGNSSNPRSDMAIVSLIYKFW